MSNKSEKKRIKEEKKAAAQRSEKRNALLIKISGFILVPLVIIVLLQGLFTGAPVVAPDQITELDHVKGNPEAPLTITVYADFQCPSCLTETELMARAWSQINDKVKVVFRHFPLDSHRHAFLAARYAEAAARQGKFWEMHDILFLNQVLWAALPDAEEVFDSYAAQIGLDIEQLKADMAQSDIREKIVADQQGGIRAGVRSTPAMYLNGRPINNPRSAGELINIVNEALAQ